MAWLSQSDFEYALGVERLKQFTKDEKNPSEVDTDVLNAIITRSTAYTKAKLKKRYPNQCTNETASDTITHICLMLGVRSLYNRRPKTQFPIDLENEVTDARNLLRDISDGTSCVPEWSGETPIKTDDMEYENQDKSMLEWISEREYWDD